VFTIIHDQIKGHEEAIEELKEIEAKFIIRSRGNEAG
jgi:hypothetical protein